MASKPNLQPVPNDPAAPNQRATTTSFRIPVVWYNRVRDEAERMDMSLSQVYLRALAEYFGTFDTESWETTGDPDVYDPSRFYTHSQDKKGHSVTAHVPFPKPLMGEMATLTSSGHIPAYRHTSDIIRDAVYHRVKQVAQMLDDGGLETSVNMAMLMSDEMRLVDESQQAEELIDAMRTNAAAIYAREGSSARLKRYLAKKREDADSIPEQFRPDYISAIEDYEKRITTKKTAARRKKK